MSTAKEELPNKESSIKQKLYSILPSIISKHISLLIILTAMIVFFSTQSPYFFNQRNFYNILKQVSEIGLMAIPLTFIIISGAMDLSVGSILGLSAVTLGVAYQAGLNIWLCILPALLVGLICGALNGYLVGKMKMEGIVVTIGTMVMLRGLVYVITQGKPISGYPSSFYFLGNGDLFGIPFNILFLFAMFILAYIVINKTRFGRYIYALGNNEKTVHYSGINVAKVRMFTYLLSGVFASLAGVFMVSRLASAEATSGQGAELSVITAVLIGGTNIFGGSGSIVGTFLGLLVIGILKNGLNLMGVSSLFQNVVLGILILIAVGKQND